MASEWLPMWIMVENIRNAKAVAQRLKHMLILLAGVETKRQKIMSKPEREHFIHEAYNNWCKFLLDNYPKASVHGFMQHTTGKRTVKIDGGHLYRNFMEAMRIFHNQWNPLWAKVLTGQISGKTAEDLFREWYMQFLRSLFFVVVVASERMYCNRFFVIVDDTQVLSHIL